MINAKTVLSSSGSGRSGVRRSFERRYRIPIVTRMPGESGLLTFSSRMFRLLCAQWPVEDLWLLNPPTDGQSARHPRGDGSVECLVAERSQEGDRIRIVFIDPAKPP